MPPPTLSEDYAEIGLGEEEGDYSTPAARNYELDRTQIALNEIIGIGNGFISDFVITVKLTFPFYLFQQDNSVMYILVLVE